MNLQNQNPTTFPRPSSNILPEAKPGIQLVNFQEPAPAVFIRLPPSGSRDPLTNLSRSALNALILPTHDNGFKPPVRSVVLKGSKSASRGVRMIYVRSLLEYLQSLLPQDTNPYA